MSSVRPRKEGEIKVLAMDQDDEEEFGGRKMKRKGRQKEKAQKQRELGCWET